MRKDKCKVKTTLSFVGEDPVPVAAVVDTGAGASVASEDQLLPDWRAHAWRAPTRTRIVDASGQALRALPRLPLTLKVHNTPMHFPFIVVKRLSVPFIIGCDFQRQYTKDILPQDGKIEWMTGAVSDILGYHLGARGRQYKAPAKRRAVASSRAEQNSWPSMGCTWLTGTTRRCTGTSPSLFSWSAWVARPRCLPRAPEWG